MLFLFPAVIQEIYIPTFYSDVALFAGLVLMMLFTAINLVRHIRELVGAQPGGAGHA